MYNTGACVDVGELPVVPCELGGTVILLEGFILYATRVGGLERVTP